MGGVKPDHRLRATGRQQRLRPLDRLTQRNIGKELGEKLSRRDVDDRVLRRDDEAFIRAPNET